MFFYIIPTNLHPNSQPLLATIPKPNTMNTTDSPPIALLIVNPHSGPNHKRSFQWLLYTNTRRILRNAGYEVRIEKTQCPGHATELAQRAAAQGVTLVIAAGGDGTVNEVAKGLLNSNVPLAIIPRGSGNGLARHLAIPLRTRAALRTATGGTPLHMDCGLAAGIPFVTTAGVGLDAEIGWEFANLNGRGMRNYIRATAELYFRYKPRTFELEVDGHWLQRRALLLTFANASQFGNNALIAPTARVDDGLLTLVVVRPFPKVAIGFLAALLFQGMVDRTSYVETINFTRLRVRCNEEKVHGHVDGEPVSFPGEFGVEIRPSALRVVAGPQAPELTGVPPRLFLTPRNLVKRMRAAGIEGRFARLYERIQSQVQRIQRRH